MMMLGGAFGVVVSMFIHGRLIAFYADRTARQNLKVDGADSYAKA